ncbi:MAG TPA: hypothetical protein VHE35_26190 [Kofleriaceae bacterium]|nr:hypothetical protein [Kofleriaceae bacterium]
MSEAPDTDDDEADDELGPLEHVDRLERQAERGGMYTHSVLSGVTDRINELEPCVYGLIDALVARGVIDRDAIVAAAAAARDELIEKDEQLTAGVAVRLDDEAPEPVAVDCAARLPICRSVCCQLSFALTVEEIEAGRTRWDLGQPYFVRHEADGYCTHRHAASGACTIYEVRPGVCKHYSCAGDTRIWKDFERMELNHEWLDANLGEDQPRLVSALMHRPEDLLRKVKPRTDRGK